MAKAKVTALEPNKAKALAALLDSNTLTEAATKAGISRKTMYSYMRNDKEFAKAFQDAQNALVLTNIEDAVSDKRRAKETILAIMEDEKQPAAIRLKAAQSILEVSTVQQDKADKLIENNINVINATGIFGDMF